MPAGLAAGEIVHGLAIETGALLEFDLHELTVPFGHWCFDIALNRVARVRVQRPIALYRRTVLIIPHADRRTRCMPEESDRVRIHAAVDLLFGTLRTRRRRDLVARAANDELVGQQVLPAVANPECVDCLLYTSPSPRDVEESRMPSSA